MNPGAITIPLASITVRPRSVPSETASIRPPVMPTERIASVFVSGSMTRPFSRTTSKPPSAVWGAQADRSSNAIDRVFFMMKILRVARRHSLFFILYSFGFRLIEGTGEMREDP